MAFSYSVCIGWKSFAGFGGNHLRGNCLFSLKRYNCVVKEKDLIIPEIPAEKLIEPEQHIETH